jgi:predicted acyltransferase
MKVPTEKPAVDNSNLHPRLASLDILRGFDMFWIVGGGSLLGSLITYLGWPCLEPVAKHLEHAEWIGFTAWDLIFPLFIFISGAAMPFSFEKYLVSQQKRLLYFKIIRRALILICLGWLYNGLLKTLDFSNFRYLSVLGLIGLAYLWASLIIIHSKPLQQAVWAIVILIGYYLVMKFIPVPGLGAGILTREGNFASFIDRLIVPGRLHEGTSDPEGLLMTLPASVLAISGALAGTLIKNQNISRYRKCLWIAAAGIGCLCVGLFWGQYFPIIKKLWTSAFVVYTTGWSLLLLAVFYLIVDIWGIKKVFFPFLLIGVNPLTLYLLANRIINFKYTAEFFFGGLIRIAGDSLGPVILNAGVLLCEFVFLYILYRKKIFLRI